MSESVPKKNSTAGESCLTHTHTETGRLVIFNRSNALERISGTPVDVKR